MSTEKEGPAKKRRGRPYKSEERLKNYTVKLSQPMIDRCKEQAEAFGVTESMLVRQALQHGLNYLDILLVQRKIAFPMADLADLIVSDHEELKEAWNRLAERRPATAIELLAIKEELKGEEQKAEEDFFSEEEITLADEMVDKLASLSRSIAQLASAISSVSGIYGNARDWLKEALKEGEKIRTEGSELK